MSLIERTLKPANEAVSTQPLSDTKEGSMDTQQETLTISWTCQQPPAEAQSWFSWPTRSRVQHPLEESLNWPHGTLAILEEAFQNKLHRFCGWDLSSVIDPAPYLQAAQIYKRGVPTTLSKVDQAGGSYPLRLEPSNYPFQNLQVSGKRLLVDATVAALWQISAGDRITLFAIDETSKNLETVAKILQTIQDDDNDEKYILIGGGVFCDTAAFAVGLLGRRFELVPTTLLAMVDACVGGKTGVNFPPFGKNQLGLFLFPERVLIWTGWLKTLEPRQIRAGLAECFKHALLSDNADLLQAFQGPLDISSIENHLPNLIAIKAKVVSQDPGENGLRATLNLGHTFAHSIEALSHKRGQPILLHGEAVAIGLVFQAILSTHLGYLAEQNLQKIIHTLKKCQCLISKQELALYLGTSNLKDPQVFQAILTAIHHDKKNTDQLLSQWVLLQDFGKTVRTKESSYTVSVNSEDIATCYQRILQILD